MVVYFKDMNLFLISLPPSCISGIHICFSPVLAASTSACQTIIRFAKIENKCGKITMGIK